MGGLAGLEIPAVSAASLTAFCNTNSWRWCLLRSPD